MKDPEIWRVKMVAGWALLAPVGAMVLVVALGGGAGANEYVVDSHALGPRPDSVFDDLVTDVPPEPGIDGSVGTEKKSQIGVPITGTTDGKPLPPGTPVIGNASGIPGTVLAAYQRAANELAVAMPGCGITWPLLAGIGKVESSHASGGRVDATGRTNGEILGPVLNGGAGMAAISDTDHGRYDGNSQWDRAVGPMQFIPGSWEAFGADGNGDGVKDPHNVFDASRAAADYLCSGGSNLRDPQRLVKAVLRYNHSMEYVSTVLRWMQTYSQTTITIPDTPGSIIPPDDHGNVEEGNDPSKVTTPTPTPTIVPPTPTRPTTGTPTPSKPTPSKPTTTTPWPPKTPQSTKPPWTLPPEPRPTPRLSTPATTPPPSTPTPPVETPTDPATPSDTPVTETPGEGGANP